MTTLCLCDWVESDENRAWRANASPSLVACQAIRSTVSSRDRFADNLGKGGIVRLAVPLNTITQEYVS